MKLCKYASVIPIQTLKTKQNKETSSIVKKKKEKKKPVA